jgi:hypothetical protein
VLLESPRLLVRQRAEATARYVAANELSGNFVLVVHVSSTEMDEMRVGLCTVKLRSPRSIDEGPGSASFTASPRTVRGRRKTTGSVRVIASLFFLRDSSMVVGELRVGVDPSGAPTLTARPPFCKLSRRVTRACGHHWSV